jgi:hypothetical protein
VADVAGELVPGLLDGELLVHLSPVGVVHRVYHCQEVEGLGCPPVLGVGHLGLPEPLVLKVLEARGEAVAEHLEYAEDHVGVGGVVGGTISGFTPPSRFSTAGPQRR